MCKPESEGTVSLAQATITKCSEGLHVKRTATPRKRAQFLSVKCRLIG